MTKQSSEEPQQRRNMDIAEDHSAMTIPDDVMMKAHKIIGDIAHRGGVASHHGNIMPTAEGARLIARAILAERELHEDKIDGLLADLDSAVEVAWKRGAREWVRLNYPDRYEILLRGNA